MDYRVIYTDKYGVQWAVTDYGDVRMGRRYRLADRRRRYLIIAWTLFIIALVMIVAVRPW